MAAPSGQVILPRTDMGGFPEETTLHHGLASWDAIGTYTWPVPHGVTRLLIEATGAQGGLRCVHWADVAPGTTLTIVVGDGSDAPSGQCSCTGPGFVVTGGCGAFAATATLPSGGNVLADNSFGYVLIQW